MDEQTQDTTNTPNATTTVEVPADIAEQLPAGTQVVQTEDGALKAIVPGQGADPESEGVVHHIVTDVEHTLEALVAKVKHFVGATDQPDDA